MPEQNSSISSFKQFLMYIMLPLLLITGTAGMVFVYVFEKKVIFGSDICGAYKVNRILNETHSTEIPIFGSSRAEGGYIPDSLGSNYFNYGLSGTTYDVTLFFLEEECKKKKSTPWIILNLDLYGLKYQLGDLANYVPNAGNETVKKLLGGSYVPYYSVPIVKYFGLYETYLRDYLNNRMQLTKLTNKGAAVEKNVLAEKEFQQLVAERRNASAKFECDSILETKLTGIIKAHPERKFVFVVAPYHQSYFERFYDQPKADEFFGMLRSFPNVRLLDFSKTTMADSLFFNTTHINYKGAIAFNHVLKDSLAAIGVN
jgi:hypothetical protein